MYKCDVCGANADPNQPMLRMVTETRPVVYTRTEVTPRGREIEIEVGRGTEIVTEQHLCPKCAGVEPKQAAKPAPISLKKTPMYEFEVVLANGKRHQTNSPASLSVFYNLNSPKGKRDK